MRKRKFSIFIVLVLLFTLLYSQNPVKTKAATGSSLNEKVLTTTPIEAQFEPSEQTHWYKVMPTNEDVSKNTHFRIKLQSEQELNISVYSSLENALNDNTFDRYMGYTYSNEPAQIEFPLAWTGPYYIKVENYNSGLEEGESKEFEGEEGPDSPPIVNPVYTISYEGDTLAPSDSPIGDQCPAELGVLNRENGKGILKDLRMIRETLLANTDKGREFTSLYYKTAPFLGTKMIVNKALREDVYKNLVQLKGLFADLAENGDQSSYIIKTNEQQAINNLYKILQESVPGFLKKQIEQKAAEIGISNLTNSSLSSVIEKLDLKTSNDKEENRMIVKLKEGKPLSQFKTKVKAYGLRSINPLNVKQTNNHNLLVVEMNKTNQFKIAIKQIANLPEVEFVEPIQQYKALTADTQYKYQWSLHENEGNTGPDKINKDANIQFEKLQNLINGQLKDTVVAVVDTGVDHTLADLQDKVQSDQGYNFINRTNNIMDDNGHGTHVSGIIAASANNGYSMAGISPSAKILPVKVLDSSGSGDTEQIALGILYAADHGAKVINLSLGGPYSRTIEYALQYANKKNITVVAASGNDGFEEVSYPASSKYVIAVGSTNRLNVVSDFSNYGEGLDLVAPGSDIPSLVPNGNVTYASGTSMAAPHVSAVASLLLSQQPNLTPSEIQYLLTKTANDISFNEQDNPNGDFPGTPDQEYPQPTKEVVPGYDQVSGWGNLNAYSAFSAVALNANVDRLLNNQTKVTGTAINGSTVKVLDGDTELGEGKATASGTFTVNIPVQKSGKLLNVIISTKGVDNGPETTFRIAVEKAPEKPTVQPLSNIDEYLTGNAAPKLTVNIKDSSRKVIKTGNTDDSGAFKIKIDKQKGNTVLYVTVSDDQNRESSEVKVTVKDVILPNSPKVKPVSDRDEVIKGSSEANAQITAKVNGKVIGTSKADRTGAFEIKIKKQKAGYEIAITAKNAAGNSSKETKIKVIDKTPPATPKVNAVDDNSTVIKGKTEANANVSAKVNGKVIGTSKADKTGAFKIKIKKQKAYTIIAVTVKDATGNSSKETRITVIDKTPPATPKVNVVNDKSTAVRGKTEANATITIKVNNKTIGIGKANKHGNFFVGIKKQKAGTVLVIKAKDKAGNVSKGIKTTVKKSK
ncbi:peptidase S8 [Bacillus salipaludis]|uniref:Ig-like domain-containing protein n=1 Tax=Bacillus salipaludis TaxID=2547811 RepID=A0A4R5VJW9_9BACI|nr:Ig-like domain-containing protein [Bacillus salipaludis]MDQ6598896.1 Ig-like domain-containing protein [Bacillus salipaludis]TDK58201.1 peptidase S8 [Bacillus salipaludis]